MSKIYAADALIEEAQRATGLDRFDSDSFREGLDVFLGDVNKQELPESGHARMHGSLVKILSDRLETTAYLDTRPELLDQPVERPLFVFGIPRTGTTLLSNLLAADPNRRSALSWEIDNPVPPPTADALYTDPRAIAALEREKQMLAAMPEMGKYYRSSAIYPNECIFFMEHDFKALSLESRGKMPTYREWLFSTDMSSAYSYHRKFLQVHQADAPGIWNLKMPSHILYLDALLAEYPDARLVWAHRDPLTALGSFCSILTLGAQGFTGEADYNYIGQNCLNQELLHIERGMQALDRYGEDRFAHVHYAELTRDPLGTIRSLYAALGDDFTPEAETAMQAWLDDNPQGKFGKHEYKLAAYNLDADAVKPRFEPYISRFNVEAEG
jgi:hypothetical protein